MRVLERGVDESIVGNTHKAWRAPSPGKAHDRRQCPEQAFPRVSPERFLFLERHLKGAVTRVIQFSAIGLPNRVPGAFYRHLIDLQKRLVAATLGAFVDTSDTVAPVLLEVWIDGGSRVGSHYFRTSGR